MEYNIVVAPDLELLATKVAGFIPMGWKLKGGILEHLNGYAQQLVRHPGAVTRTTQRKPAAIKAKRTKWIE
ncbi:hypothetical protein [Pontibacter cellulosilyticus]|uniref:Uncharacterized protein n=1 Tax=Pontibacter cellulosilyticus TaxID=1720253 RepID=A0A923N5E0_9BACT|nr:hypothetical protein [Pontibacter cellulosilyticus]MBC5991217.1 hypothetical protein [Pontibacter cellulosilyticus]